MMKRPGKYIARCKKNWILTPAPTCSYSDGIIVPGARFSATTHCYMLAFRIFAIGLQD
jgi:hypothetical protein